MRAMKIEWPEIGSVAVADLADDLNPTLCDELWSKLPFTVTQEHPVVSGSSLTCWVPYLSKADVEVNESIVDAPVGRLRFSQKTGSKISIQYGPGIEPAMQGVLGKVRDGDIEVLAAVGETVWNNLMWGKRVLTVRYSADDDDASRTISEIDDASTSELALRITRAADSYANVEPPDMVAIRTGRVEGAGSFGQFFSVVDAANGLIRDLTVHTLYPIYRSLGSYSVETIIDMYRVIGANYQFTLGYHGYRELAGFVGAVDSALEHEANRTEKVIAELLEALLCYTNRMYSWSHHNFPWYLARGFPKPGVDVAEAGTWSP